MRPLWTGSISFGLVNIPVRMFSGAEAREGLDLDMLHKEDHGRIRYARICRKDGQEVAWEDIVKGYQYREGDYVVLTNKDFEKVDAKKTQTIDIQQFTESDGVDIRYFEKPYYLEPVKGGEKAYALLHNALAETKKLALVKYVVHQREHLGALQPVGRAIVLMQMRFPTDLRQAGELNFPANEHIAAKELDMATKLIKQETKPFIPEDYHDTFTEEIEEMIAAKVKGQKPTKHAAKAKDTSAGDLMDALKASLKDK